MEAQKPKTHEQILNECINNGLLQENKNKKIHITEKGLSKLNECLQNLTDKAMKHEYFSITKDKPKEVVTQAMAKTWSEMHEGKTVTSLLDAVYWEEIGWETYLQWSQAKEKGLLN